MILKLHMENNTTAIYTGVVAWSVDNGKARVRTYNFVGGEDVRRNLNLSGVVRGEVLRRDDA